MRREVVVHENPKSPISEIFRTLRTNIQFMNSKNAMRSLLVTSTLPGEGKSWIASNLAVTFAKADKKVVLIDSDMRKGRLHKIFGLENEKGLSNYLSGIDDTSDITRYIQRTEEPNLFLISKGDVPPNPSELLSSEMTIKMIRDLERMFDLVIFDGTPSLIVTDAVILSRLVSSTIIVSEHNVTKKENLAKVKRDIENVGGKIAGVVINKIPKQGKKYGSSYYYSYGYGYVYGTDEKTGERIKIKKRKKVRKEYSDLASENDAKGNGDVDKKKLTSIESANLGSVSADKLQNEKPKVSIDYIRKETAEAPKISMDYVQPVTNFTSNEQAVKPAANFGSNEQIAEPVSSFGSNQQQNTTNSQQSAWSQPQTNSTTSNQQSTWQTGNTEQRYDNAEEKRRQILEKVDEYINQIKK